MKKILVISGKGGTGKTFFTASIACLAGDKKIIVDCDVDASNLHLLLHPNIQKREAFKGGFEAEIDQSNCIQCAKCFDVCRFEAINKFKDETENIIKIEIDSFSCEGCGACKYVCPTDAIIMEEKVNGEWFLSETKYGPFIFAKLGIAEENSGKLVSKIKEEASKLAIKQKAEYMIIDGPPGIGCPVIASMSGVDIALVVTEPTLSGISDMLRVVKVAEFFGIETKVIINKYDINLENTRKIEELCREKNLELIGQIPFSKEVIKSIVQAVPYVEYSKDDISEQIKNIWHKIL